MRVMIHTVRPSLFVPLSLPSCVLSRFNAPLYLGSNDGGIKRGDREETGDNEAEPTEKGSGPAQPTFDPTSFGGESSIGGPTGTVFDLEEEREDSDGLEIMEATDGRLGLTNVGEVPADDWAADTGETKNPEGTR